MWESIPRLKLSNQLGDSPTLVLLWWRSGSTKLRCYVIAKEKTLVVYTFKISKSVLCCLSLDTVGRQYKSNIISNLITVVFIFFQPLPAKHTLLGQLDRYSREFVLCRMAMLHRFLNRIINHPILSFHPTVRVFLTTKPAVSPYSTFSLHIYFNCCTKLLAFTVTFSTRFKLMTSSINRQTGCVVVVNHQDWHVRLTKWLHSYAVYIVGKEVGSKLDSHCQWCATK